MAKVQKRFIGVAALVAVFFLSAAAVAGIDVSTTKKLRAANGEGADYFGTSISASGNTIAIGAPGRFVYSINQWTGAAYVFTHEPSGSWKQEAFLFPSDGKSPDYFGSSISISGKTVVVGGIQTEAAYVFVNGPSGWTQEAKLVPPNNDTSYRFGYAVSVDKNTAVIGSCYDNEKGNDAGAAYVFVRSSDGVWKLQTKLMPNDDLPANECFGYSVAVQENTAVIGAYRDFDNGYEAGSAYVFVRDSSGAWHQQAELTPASPQDYDRFGWSVSVDRDTVVVGAPTDDSKREDAGSAYIFSRDSSGNWSQQKRLQASDMKADDLFGSSVSVSADNIVIGGAAEKAYIFSPSGSELSKLTEPSQADQDHFGSSVCTSDNTLLVGAPRDNGATGSVYIYGSSPKNGFLPAILSLLSDKTKISSTLNDNVITVDENRLDDIVSTGTQSTGETELYLSGETANSAQTGSIIYMPPDPDDRFPFGIAGKVASSSDNADGTKTVILDKVSYADLIKEATFNLDNITLDASNFIGVIAPSAVQSASPALMAAKSLSSGNFHSFRDGAIIIRENETEISPALSHSRSEIGGTIDTDVGTISFNMKVDLGKMGDGVTNTMVPVNGTSVGFVIAGSLKNIKLTNEHDFSLLGGGLKSLDLRMDSDLNFDVKFNGKGTVKFGYFSQAWNEVKEESFKVFGVNGKLTGLSADDKIGKFPLAGLVFSVPCPPQKPCIITPGNTQTPLQRAKAMGVIIWLYLTTEGELSLDGDLTLAHLNPGRLSLGIKKPYGSDLQLVRSLERNGSSGRLIEAPKFQGSLFDAQFKAGISIDMDFFAMGVRIANAGADIGVLAKMALTGEVGYGTDSLNSSWSWDGNTCFTGSIGAGAVFRAAAGLGIEIDTRWKDISGGFEYEYQYPSEEEMNQPGRHGFWYTLASLTKCTVIPTIHITTPGDGWIDYTGTNGFYIRGTVDINQVPVPERMTFNIYNGSQEVICPAQYYDQWDSENYVYDDVVDKSVTVPVDPVTGSFEAVVDFNGVPSKEQLEAIAHISVGETEIQTKTNIWKADGTAINFDAHTKILPESNIDECMERWGCTGPGRRDPCAR